MNRLTFLLFRGSCAAVVFALMATTSPELQAGMITQTADFTIVNETWTFSWAQFNPSLGNLQKITLSVSGSLSGSFSVTNNYTEEALARNSQNQYVFEFIGEGAPDRIYGEQLRPIQTTPPTDSTGSTIPADSTQVFTVNAGQTTTISETDLTNYADYFTGVEEVTSNILQMFSVTVSGGTYIVQPSVQNAGNAILTYDYLDAQAVPEPSSIVLTVFSLAAAGCAHVTHWKRRRRRQAK